MLGGTQTMTYTEMEKYASMVHLYSVGMIDLVNDHTSHQFEEDFTFYW